MVASDRMHKMELRVESFNGGPAPIAHASVFGVAGGTIGRAGQNRMILPDDPANVARVHAMVRLDSDGAYIANLSERNPIAVAGLTVPAGSEVQLAPGMEVRIGPYLLRAYLPEGALTQATDAPSVLMVIPEGFDFFGNPARQELKDVQDDEGFAATASLADIVNVNSDALLQSLPERVTTAEAMDNPSHIGLPKTLDPVQVVDPMALFGASGLADLLDIGAATDTAKPFGFELSVGANPPMAHQDVGSTTHLGAPLPNATTEQVSPEQSAASAHRPGALRSVGPPMGSSQSLMGAFLKGAQVDAEMLDVAVSAAFMHSFGEAFRVAVQGTMDLLSIRSEVKREFHAGLTIISSGANNPLKFLPTAEGVIQQLAGNSLPGFMGPAAALNEAYQDLRVHQGALMAGLRAACAEALARFDPAEIENLAETDQGLLARFSSRARKAALWDAYLKRYAHTRRMAEDDLVAFSGQTFLSAYEAAAAQCKRGTP